MSLGYADRLSHREDLGGRLGDPELSEAPHALLDKAHALADLVQGADKVVAFTGAGISTAAGIPDFRGPRGVWTLQRAGLPPPQLATSFVYALPSLTHMALLGLMRSGKLAYICSQNVDSLHLRSGVPRAQLAELHGNCFAERCRKCKAEYVRDFEMDTVGFKLTGRRCSRPGCTGALADHILDWEDSLPPDELTATQQHASSAGLALCLGTSLQIIPAANLPLRTVKAGGRLGIINLQATPKDKRADVVVHARVDEVMSLLMARLGVPIPVYTRRDSLLISHTLTAAAGGGADAAAADDEDAAEAEAAAAAGDGPSSSGSGGAGGCSWGFTLTLSSVHGPACPLPMVASARVSFLGAAGKVLRPRELSGQLPWRLSLTCPGSLGQVTALVQLRLVEAADADKRSQQVEYTISQPGPLLLQQQQQSSGSSRSTRGAVRAKQQKLQQPVASSTFAFVTQQHDYSAKQQQLVAALTAAAEASRAAASDATAELPAQHGGSAAHQQQQHSGQPLPGQQHNGQGAAGGHEDDDDDDDESVTSSSSGAGGGSGLSSDDAGAQHDSSDDDYVGGDDGASGRRHAGRGRPRKRSKRGATE